MTASPRKRSASPGCTSPTGPSRHSDPTTRGERAKRCFESAWTRSGDASCMNFVLYRTCRLASHYDEGCNLRTTNTKALPTSLAIRACVRSQIYDFFVPCHFYMRASSKQALSGLCRPSPCIPTPSPSLACLLVCLVTVFRRRRASGGAGVGPARTHAVLGLPGARGEHRPAFTWVIDPQDFLGRGQQ